MSLKVAPEKVDVSDERTRSKRDFQIVVAAAWKEAEPSHAFPVNLGLGRSLSSENKKQLKQLCIEGSAPGTPCTMDLSSLRPPVASLLRPDRGAEYCDERVCLYVCVCTRSYLQIYTSNVHQFFVHVTYSRGSVVDL